MSLKSQNSHIRIGRGADRTSFGVKVNGLHKSTHEFRIDYMAFEASLIIASLSRSIKSTIA